ncbi:MAG: type II toxin-antitoxin system PemK/MazF family toxin [Roseiflexaceae bacterium]|nr:type II toxin-antitoxin system PemK/MazF family toxin [Roseiflexaceae bacterium]
MVIQRFAVFLINLDPTQGVEIPKTRPCVIISPDELNAAIQTVIIAPMTTKSRNYPSRVGCRFEDRDAHIVLDQIRTVDKRRLIKPLGLLDATTQRRVLQVLADMFAE